MTKATNPKKLFISKETIRQLQTESMVTVEGGAMHLSLAICTITVTITISPLTITQPKPEPKPAESLLPQIRK